MKNTKRILALVLVMVMAVALMAGCGTTGSGSSASEPTSEAPVASNTETEPTESAEAPETEDPAEETEASSLPLVEEAATLTLWDTFNPTVLSYIDGWSEHPVLQQVYDMTNVYIEATCVAGNKGAEAFQLLLAGEEYYDIMSSFDNFYTGGLDQAIDDEVILNLTDLINQYAPDYLAAIEEQDCMKDCTTNNGNMGAFCNIVYNGYRDKGQLISKTMLDELGMDVPTTYDELHDALAGMKSLGATAPLWVNYFGIGQSHSLAAGYNITSTYDAMGGSYPFFVEDGKVVFSWDHERFKEFLTMMNQWYNEGLIWSDFVSDGAVMNISQSNAVDLVYTGNMGVFFSGVDFIDTMAAEGIELVALPEPTLNGTDKIHTVQPNSAKARTKFCITTECEDPELAVRFLNVFFQKDIAELCDYGIEGQAYNMENGERQFTDLLLNNPDGLASGNARRIYCVDDWCFYQNKGRDLYFYSDKGVEATQVFADQMDYTMAIPLGLSLTAEESDTFSTEFNEISTYALESIASFVLGDKNLESDWDEYVAQLEAMGSKDITEIYQAAYDRYMAK